MVNKNILLIFALIVTLISIIHTTSALPNPAAVYCEELGYQYKIISDGKGERGICIFSDINKSTEDLSEGEINDEEPLPPDSVIINEMTKSPATENEEMIVTSDSKEVIYSTLNEGTDWCEAWQFVEGKCGEEYSYCNKQGYGIETVSDGKNPYSPEYAICVPREKAFGALSMEGSGSEKISVTDHIDLRNENKVEEVKSVKADATTTRTVGYTTSSPPSFDWRNKDGQNWLTPVKNQGSCGSCWDFAALGEVESKIKIARNDPDFDVDLSEQDVLSCSGAGNCLNGGGTMGALNYVKDFGVTDELCLPYTAVDSDGCTSSGCGYTPTYCSDRCSSWDNRLWKVDNTEYVPDDRETIKNYLIEKGPLVASLDWGAGYYDNGIFRCSGSSSSWHAVVIVGYNDAEGYWIIKNSWGTGWGDGGYGKVGYGECHIENYAIYSDLTHKATKEAKVESINVLTGTSSGSVSDTYNKDGNYITFAESCFLLNCDGLDARIYLPTEELIGASSIDLIAYHQARWESGFGLWFWNENDDNWESFDSVPNSEWKLMKYTLCDSKTECSDIISSGDALIDYFHPSCSWCDTDYVDVDWMFLEAIPDEYCSAFTYYGNDEYITRVELNGEEKISTNSTYTDYTDSVFTTLNRGVDYTISVDAYTAATFTEYVKVWIDFDNDNDFSEGEEIDLGSSSFSGHHTFSKSFTVPYYANVSETRMRVYLKFGDYPTPCEAANWGEVEDYKVRIIDDISPPYVWVHGHGVGYIEAGNTAIINAEVYDNYGVSSIYAEIESLDGSTIETVELFDDGLHFDGDASDAVYGNSWITPGSEENYVIDFIATDIHGNSYTYEDWDKFTTIPFIATSKILLVDNSFYMSYIDYYEDALGDSGNNYDLWDFDLRGDIKIEIIDDYDVWIWSSPLWEVPDTNQQSALRQFLDNGGNLFISGQDLGLYLNGTEFYQNYLHAKYVQDYVNLHVLSGVSGDPIGGGMLLEISGGDGANNQWWPSEIDPLPPADSIFLYVNTTTSTSVEIPNPPEFPIELKAHEKTKDYYTMGISSTGTGALKVDTNTYKVVYFAFGFEAINNASTRRDLMSNIINWFHPQPNISIVSPQSQFYNSEDIPLIISLNEDVEDLDYKLDEGENTHLCSDCNTSNLILYDLEEGGHKLTVFVTDDWNLSYNKSTEFSIDTIHPFIIKTEPLNESYLKGSENEMFSVTYTEMNPVISLYLNTTFDGNYNQNLPIILTNCTSGSIQTCIYRANLSHYPDGTQLYYYFRVADPFWQVWSAPVNVITIDREPPQIEIIFPKNETYATNDVDLKYSIIDNGDVDSCWYSVDSGSNSSLSDCKNITIASLSEGMHTISIHGNDTAGNENSKIISFSIDRAGPEIVIITPAVDNEIIGVNYAFINISLDEEGDTCLLEWNGVNESMSRDDTNYYKNKTTLFDDTYTFLIWCNDTYGNKNKSDLRTIIVDTKSPEMNLSIPIKGIVITGFLALEAITDEPSLCMYRPYGYANNDTIAPQITDFSPTGHVPIQWDPIISFRTDEFAACRGSINVDEVYDDMPIIFNKDILIQTDRAHIYLATSPFEISNYTVFVKCRDMLGNTMNESFNWSFETYNQTPPYSPSPGIPARGGFYPDNNSSYRTIHSYELTGILNQRIYFVDVLCTDEAKNSIADVISFETDIPSPQIILFNATGNETSIVDSKNVTDTILELFTKENLTAVSVNITKYPENPMIYGVSGSVGIKYIEIEESAEIGENLEWVMIKIYYSDDEMSEIEEQSLKIYYWNETQEQWEEMDNTGVNTNDNYVWANSTHFSFFGLFGETPYCGDGFCNGNEDCSSCSSDCGTCKTEDNNKKGGGGSFSGLTSCMENWECMEWSACINEEQTRTCTDLKNCGTEMDKPLESQSCGTELSEEGEKPVCAQIITPAVSDTGECREFATPCDVPEGWQVVDHCPQQQVNESISGGIPTGMVTGDMSNIILGAFILVVLVAVGGLFYWYRIRK